MYSYQQQLVAQKQLDDYKLECNPKIGIIMPVYNSGGTVSDSINSILEQSYNNWKLFIIDDCSTDGYSWTLQEQRDPRISVTKLEKNVGPSEARNLALKMISQEGIEYIALCDSDDVWINPNHLEESLKFLIDTNGDLCYSDVECVFENGSPAFLWVNNERINFYDDMQYEKLIQYNWMYTSTVVMRNLGLFFNKELDGIEDWDYWLQVLESHRSIYHLNRVHTKYLVKESNSVATWANVAKQEKIKIRPNGLKKIDAKTILGDLL